MARDIYSGIISKIKTKKLSLKQIDVLKRQLASKNHLPEVPTNIKILIHGSAKDYPLLKKKLLSKPVRSISGVAPVAIMTKPIKCPHGRCLMCPGGIESVFGDIPQSYTGKEPATLRAVRNNFDPYLQVFNRLEQYIISGHNCQKVELIIMGGTFPSFPIQYQEEFIKYAFKAMNDFSDLFYDSKGEFNYKKIAPGLKPRTSMRNFLFQNSQINEKHKAPNSEFCYLKFKKFFELGLEDNLGEEKRVKILHKKLLKLKGGNNKSNLVLEQTRNQKSNIRCVALCLETRPDYGRLKQGNEMLRLGCTRVELGIQSVYDSALKKICRGHTNQETIDSIQTLKDLGFKIAAHYMPGLPGIGYKKDLEGMKKLFSDPNYRPDMLKIYPCMVIRGTKLHQKYLAGKFKPLSTDQAAKLIAHFKSYVPEYCRIIRIQRDIPSTQVEAGVKITNLRQYLHERYHPKCRCIRCREPKAHKINWNKVRMSVIKYSASEGKEFFISFEDTSQDLILGFLRLRFPSEILRKEITPKSALVRELHVYGTAAGLGEDGDIQHRGMGKKLIAKAEEIARESGKDRMVIISGIGVREYYKKLGYHLEGPYMVKSLNNH